MNVRGLVNAEKECTEMIARIGKAAEVSSDEIRVFLSEADANRLLSLLEGYSRLLGKVIDKMEVDV